VPQASKRQESFAKKRREAERPKQKAKLLADEAFKKSLQAVKKFLVVLPI
jgi:hypothetical protein